MDAMRPPVLLWHRTDWRAVCFPGCEACAAAGLPAAEAVVHGPRSAPQLILHLTPQPDGGYVVTSPTHPALLTEGDTVAEALEHAKDAYASVLEMEEDSR